MLLDQITTRAHADHGPALSAFVVDWWRSWVPPVRRPTPRKPRARLA